MRTAAAALDIAAPNTAQDRHVKHDLRGAGDPFVSG
jgi:hypothetical protein